MRADECGPMLTVVIPTFRRERQLQGAIHSALAGGVENLEVLVVDDSPEQSARAAVESVGDRRVQYLAMEVPSKGKPALVRNYAISLARGRYLYCLDDDDQCCPGALGALVEALERHPRAAVAFGRVSAVGPDRAVRERYAQWWAWAARVARRVRFSSWLTTGVIMFRGTLIINSACVIRTSAARALGGNNPRLEVYEDVEFFTRGIRRYGHVFVDVPVLLYSTGLQSIMHDLDWEQSVLESSHRRFHAAYKESYGALNYRLLQVVSKLLPIERPPAPERGARAAPGPAGPGPRLHLVRPAPTPQEPAPSARSAAGGAK